MGGIDSCAYKKDLETVLISIYMRTFDLNFKDAHLRSTVYATNNTSQDLVPMIEMILIFLLNFLNINVVSGENR